MRTKGAFAGSCFVARRRGGSRLRACARGRSQEPPQPQLAESGGVIRTLGSAVGVATICSSHAARGGGTKASSFVLVQRSHEPQQPQLAESTGVTRIKSAVIARGGGAKACSSAFVQRSQEPQQPQLAESTGATRTKGAVAARGGGVKTRSSVLVQRSQRATAAAARRRWGNTHKRRRCR